MLQYLRYNFKQFRICNIIYGRQIIGCQDNLHQIILNIASQHGELRCSKSSLDAKRSTAFSQLTKRRMELQKACKIIKLRLARRAMIYDQCKIIKLYIVVREGGLQNIIKDTKQMKGYVSIFRGHSSLSLQVWRQSPFTSLFFFVLVIII